MSDQSLDDHVQSLRHMLRHPWLARDEMENLSMVLCTYQYKEYPQNKRDKENNLSQYVVMQTLQK